MQMLAGVFSDTAPESLRAAAQNITEVGLHRTPTREDVDAFVRRHAELLRSAPRSERRDGTRLHTWARATRELAHGVGAVVAQSIQERRERVAVRSRGHRRDATRAARFPRKGRGAEREPEIAAYQAQIDLLIKAMDDPQLAVVLDTYEEEVPPAKLRQFLFANALYANAVLSYRTGVVTREELFGQLRVMIQNSVFRDYWYATRAHRASLPDTSPENRIGRMVDALVLDMQEAETDEWWVVGEPPADLD